MEIKDYNAVLPELTISMTLKQNECIVIKQQLITDTKDILFAGIFKTKITKNEYYIIAAYRIENGVTSMLNYTKFAVNKDHAEKLYKEMLTEIEQDLNR